LKHSLAAAERSIELPDAMIYKRSKNHLEKSQNIIPIFIFQKKHAMPNRATKSQRMRTFWQIIAKQILVS
jgi:hypothetical protein